MSLNADALQFLVDKGFTAQDIVEFVRRTERRADPTAAERMRKYRADKKAKSVTRNVTHEPPKVYIQTPGSPLSSDEDIPCSPEIKPDQTDEAVQSWNQMASEVGLSPIRKLSSARKAALRRRLAEHGLDGWRLGIGKIRESSFCCGENDRGWRADFDFLASESGFLKVVEGKYDRAPTVRPPPNQSDFSKLVGNYEQA